MTSYELWSLIFTGAYDILTFLLLLLVAYEAFVKPKLPEVLVHFQGISPDTKQWSWRKKIFDLMIDNRGCELRNIKISSVPDELGWRNIGLPNLPPKNTSEYFADPIPFLLRGESKQIGWCDLESNLPVFQKPFTLILEFDNPVFPLPRRLKRQYPFDFTINKDVMAGLNRRYDIHNVAEECCRIREELEELAKIIKSKQ